MKKIKQNLFLSFHFQTDEDILEIVQNKTKIAAWFVSNCYSQPSNRNVLVKKLQEFIVVDVYGTCGNLTAPKNPISKFLEKNYKFYFAFENSLCADYVSEKTFKVMDAFIIPVVFSGADMARFVPPKSYIDANAFETAEDLAKHLKFLSNNPKEYVKYFWWKKHYQVNTKEQFTFPPSHMCKICQKVNEVKLSLRHQFYSNIKDWNSKGICKQATIKF